MEPIFELAIALPPRGSRERSRALHQQLRAAIVEGRLQPGLRLPPTRSLAAACGVSRNTAVMTYDLLLSEGYLTTRRGAGTYVATALPQAPDRKAPAVTPASDRRLNAFWRNHPLMPEAFSSQAYAYNFRLGLPETALFPFDAWRRVSARVLRSFSKSRVTYQSPQGSKALREAIARHVSLARAVACRAEDVIVTTGAQQAFDLLARVLITSGRTVVALEDPGYAPARAAFAAAGAKRVFVPVDEEGLIVERLPRQAKVIYVTPSHQFPLGASMSMRRRAALLEFAQARGAVVIEDDYDGEFRFGERPLDALQTLDRAESVFYVGTFSKSMFPMIRLGFIVCPPWARSTLVTAKQFTDWHCAVLAQDTLAAFIAEGHLARHVRKMRPLYDERRAELLRGLQQDFDRWLIPLPSAAGLHLTAFAHRSVDAHALANRGRENGVRVTSLRPFYRSKPARQGLIFGYGAIETSAIREGLRQLQKLLRSKP
jgi:GntR family transcriptional regulator / MocR family aminotransferase